MTDQTTEINWKARALAAEQRLDELARIKDASEVARDVIAMAEWAREAYGYSSFEDKAIGVLRRFFRLTDEERQRQGLVISTRLNMQPNQMMSIYAGMRNNPAQIAKAERGIKAWSEHKKEKFTNA
jgi:hypothetical protein